MQMLYGDYVSLLSKRFEQAFDFIMAGYNFDHGPEFEIALCKVLRMVLPQSYGIARGYVVASDGTKAGDDIIIYERMWYPTLSARDDGFLTKERIPIDAVLAYIEAKHTLKLDESDQGLAHALQQALKVRRLIATRPQRPFNKILPTVNLDSKFEIRQVETAPKYWNPPFTAICARNLLCASDPPDVDELKLAYRASGMKTDEVPDLLAAGPHVVVLPGSGDEKNIKYHLPFNTAKTEPVFCATNGHAFGIFVAALVHGLRWINLDPMPWGEIITDAMRSTLR
jgi:hypothetical protein